MTHAYHISPTNPLIIEWRLDQDGARFCFYRVCDSPNDARRSLRVLQGGDEQEAAPRGFPERQRATLFNLEEMGMGAA